jgi:riboflavin kinase/FMN adenylyltransferase
MRLLGHPYLIRGRVVRGRGLGVKLGFPTANLRVGRGKLLPRGVFAVRGWIERPGTRHRHLHRSTFMGVCNIGTRPTVGGKPVLGAEVHVFNWHRNLVGRTLCIELVERLRTERKFPSLPALTRAIARDVVRAKKILRRSIPVVSSR